MADDYYQLLRIDGATAKSRTRDASKLPPVVGDGQSWWRPGELLVHLEAVDDLAGLLADVDAVRFGPDAPNWRNDRNARADAEFNARVADASGYELWVRPPGSDVDVRDVVAKGRGLLGRTERSISLNTVYVGEGYYMGGPGSAVGPADEPSAVQVPRTARSMPSVTLSVLDTGVPFDWDHQEYRLRGVLTDSDVLRPDDLDALDEDGNSYLDRQAAHGLFICGLANRMAPDIRIDPDRVLSSFGLCDDADLINGLKRSAGTVVNLSLGGYTPEGAPPEALATAIQRMLDEGRVVVAAAGNDYEDEARHGVPFYPAALPGVISVGAYDSETGEPAVFSNRGDWVRVWAPGVNLVSDFVTAWPVEPVVGATVPGRLGATVRDWWLEILRRRYRRSFRGWARWSGTSFAAPLVAAEIAHRVMADPATPPAVVAEKFLESLPSAGYPDTSGVLFTTGDFTR